MKNTKEMKRDHNIYCTDWVWEVWGEMARLLAGQGRIKIKKGGGGQSQAFELVAKAYKKMKWLINGEWI